MFEATKKRPGDKRRREKPGDPEEIDGYLGKCYVLVNTKTMFGLCNLDSCV